MWFHSLLASSKSSSYSRRPEPWPVRNPRLAVEYLADRSLPSSYSAANVSALIADISASNTAGGANTIELTAQATSPYVLTAANNDGGIKFGIENGLPLITANDNLTIVGNGDTIERSSTISLQFRLLDVASGATLTLENLTLQSGFAGYPAQTAGPAYGGAIYNQGTLTLSDVIVVNNQAFGGENGAGNGGGIWTNGSLTLENGTLLEGNIAQGGESGSDQPHPNAIVPNGDGGAVYIAGGTANITNTTFIENAAVGGSYDLTPGLGNALGGALYVVAGTANVAGTVNITSSIMNNNFTETLNTGSTSSLSCGGCLYVAHGTVILTSDTVLESGPATTADGSYDLTNAGGIYVIGGTVTLTDCTVQGSLCSFTIASGGDTVYIDPYTLANSVTIVGKYIET